MDKPPGNLDVFPASPSLICLICVFVQLFIAEHIRFLIQWISSDDDVTGGQLPLVFRCRTPSQVAGSSVDAF